MMVCIETDFEGTCVFVGSRQALPLLWNLNLILSISKAKPLPFIGYLSTVVIQKRTLEKIVLYLLFYLVVSDR